MYSYIMLSWLQTNSTCIRIYHCHIRQIYERDISIITKVPFTPEQGWMDNVQITSNTPKIQLHHLLWLSRQYGVHTHMYQVNNHSINHWCHWMVSPTLQQTHQAKVLAYPVQIHHSFNYEVFSGSTLHPAGSMMLNNDSPLNITSHSINRSPF